MNDKIYSMLGLAQKAGKLVSGDGICEITIRAKKCFLVIIAKDASEKTKKKYINMCRYRNIKILEYGEKEKLGKCIGKSARSVIALKDVNFSRKITELIIEKINGSGGEPIAKKST